MNGDFDRDELRTLFAALNDGAISQADHSRLEGILAASAEARRLWFLQCDIETGLADWAAMKRESGLQNVVAFEPASRRPARSAWWWLATAAVIMLTAAWWMRDHGKRSLTADAVFEEPKANGVAVLARAVGVEWTDGVERASGAVLEPGTLRLKSGAALVEFFSGARVVLEGPAEFRLVSSGEAFLLSGKISAHVPPQARGFTVGSSEIKVVDFGTDFGFSVGRDTAPEVHVFTGKVEVASAKLAPRAMSEGEAVRFDAGSPSPIPASRAAFLSEEELGRRDAASALERFSVWLRASRVLSEDPGTAVHFTFDEEDSPERRITNHGTDAAFQSHGTIVGSAWIDGRWPGKRALQFRGQGDRIRFSSPQPMNAVTLLAWLRVDSLSRGQNVLLSADSKQTGALHWLLTNRGELRLEIARDLGRLHADWEAVNSAPFVTSDRFGQWLLLATTFDGKTIRHYANGELIGSGASFTPPSVIIGTAEIGNWRGGTQRHLAAALDEFAVLSRVMSEDEVRAAYEAGKP